MNNILCSVSTRGRYLTTFPLTLQAIICQTHHIDHLVIFDDNDPDSRVDIREIPHVLNLLRILESKGTTWQVIYGACKGQHFNHQIANKMGYTWVWRVDDDCVPEPNVLEKLYSWVYNYFVQMGTMNIGAVGGSVITPEWNLQPEDAVNASGKIEDIYTRPNMQWWPITSETSVDHLHCSFLYRAGIVDYNLNLSKVAHREETLFTYQLKQAGYDIYVVPCTTWHLKAAEGGIRDGVADLFKHDEAIFAAQLNSGTLCVLDCGIGDHLVFLKLLPEIQKLHPKISIACCYPKIFASFANMENMRLISIAEAVNITDVMKFNVYKFMHEKNWTGDLYSAFEALYKELKIL